MTKTDYKLLYTKKRDELLILSEKKKLLLHSCCAPCSSSVLERVTTFLKVDIFYYNPNIEKAEFDKRLAEQQDFVNNVYKDVSVIAPLYNESEFLDKVTGLEALPERGERCKICYALRLEKTAEYAKLNGYDYFTTTLSVSPHKNAEWINELGFAFAKKYGVEFLPSDFKKDGGYLRSTELSKEYGLYRQNFCGCKFSKPL